MDLQFTFVIHPSKVLLSVTRYILIKTKFNQNTNLK